jgi:hypothetical protein
MKKMRILAIAMIAMVTTMGVKAQEFEVGADVVSSYVWRGSKAAGASIQPGVTFTAGGFSLGAWGSAAFNNGLDEMDLFTSYAFDFGLSVGLTDYYYPGVNYFDGASHGFEVNLGYGIKDFSVSGNYMLNEGAGTLGGDTYFELGYAFKSFSIFAGAGSGWHTSDGDFGLVNVGISTSKDIKITDSFTLPLSGSVILNPEKQQFFIVAAISL